MLIWIDLGNSPHVPFFLALAEEFETRGHKILWTARDYAQTVELAKKAGLPIKMFGSHGGKNVLQKGLKFGERIFSLIHWARGKKIDLAVSHNSHEPLAVAKLLGIKSVNLMDYEHHPANHLSFRLASRVIVPESFPAEYLQKFGVSEKKVRRFPGIKEDVYLADFEREKNFGDELRKFGVEPENILIVVRPHAPEALYHRQFSNEILDEMLERFSTEKNVKIVLLPRKTYQGKALREKHKAANIIIPSRVLDGANLIAAADWVISGGGTMNREAAALGVPVATIFVGKPAAIDEMLIREGRMLKIESHADLEKIKLTKKSVVNARKFLQTKSLVADLILDEARN
jgi:predicted glycosyltransferase